MCRMCVFGKLALFTAHEAYARTHESTHARTHARASVSRARGVNRGVAPPPIEWASSTSVSAHDPSRADSDRRLTTSRSLAAMAVSTVSLARFFRRRLLVALVVDALSFWGRTLFLLVWNSYKSRFRESIQIIIAFCFLPITQIVLKTQFEISCKILFKPLIS